MGLSQEILGLDDLVTKEVTVPVWNKTLTIREMGLQDALRAFNPDSLTDDGKIRMDAEDIASVVAACVIDPETGERVFGDKDVAVLARKNRKALMFLYNEITGLSGSAEEAEKN